MAKGSSQRTEIAKERRFLFGHDVQNRNRFPQNRFVAVFCDFAHLVGDGHKRFVVAQSHLLGEKKKKSVLLLHKTTVIIIHFINLAKNVAGKGKRI